MQKNHILSAGIVPVFRQNSQTKILMLRSYKNWDFPKGVVEPGEEPLDGARRELQEETLITAVSFPWGYAFQETAPYGAGKIARYYIAECASLEVELPVSPELGHPEHQEFRWVEMNEARQLVSLRLLPIVEWAEQMLVSEPRAH